MMTYSTKTWRIEFAPPSLKAAIFLGFVAMFSVIMATFVQDLAVVDLTGGLALIGTGLMMVFYHSRPPNKRIETKIKVGLFYPRSGNPLHLSEGELLPRITVKAKNHQYVARIESVSIPIDNLQKMSEILSQNLTHQDSRFACIAMDVDRAFNYIDFILADVLSDRTLRFSDVSQMKPPNHTTIRLDQDHWIDLKAAAASYGISGRTRSGKTQFAMTLLIQFLLMGRDRFGSSVVVIDPKQAELSRIDGVVSLDSDAGGREILAALKQFWNIIRFRQQILNAISAETGDAMKWYDVGMVPNVLFLDEYVALRSLFPKKPEPGTDYCLGTFDALIARILTTCASSGSFCILSIAQASVDSAGLPSMLKQAMTSWFLFKPSPEEAAIVWGQSAIFKSLPPRLYGPGECVFTSQDGVHDQLTYCHMPIIDFALFREFGRLLAEYNSDISGDDGEVSQDGARAE